MILQLGMTFRTLLVSKPFALTQNITDIIELLAAWCSDGDLRIQDMLATS